MIKLAMIKIQKKLDESKVNAKMLLQVHDELIFECLKDDEDKAKEIIKEAMESALEINVPLLVDIGSGSSWLEAH